jgi:hypothetical protein
MSLPLEELRCRRLLCGLKSRSARAALNETWARLALHLKPVVDFVCDPVRQTVAADFRMPWASLVSWKVAGWRRVATDITVTKPGFRARGGSRFAFAG